MLGVVLLRSAPMYSALGVCCGGVCVSIGLLIIVALYIKRGESLFSSRLMLESLSQSHSVDLYTINLDLIFDKGRFY